MFGRPLNVVKPMLRRADWGHKAFGASRLKGVVGPLSPFHSSFLSVCSSPILWDFLSRLHQAESESWSLVQRRTAKDSHNQHHSSHGSTYLSIFSFKNSNGLLYLAFTLATSIKKLLGASGIDTRSILASNKKLLYNTTIC